MLDVKTIALARKGGSGGMPDGGEPNKQLVTDGDGNAKWEDRLAYSDSKSMVVVDFGAEQGIQFVNVSDSFPFEVQDSATYTVFLNYNNSSLRTGTAISQQVTSDIVTVVYDDMPVCIFVLSDCAEYESMIFPKKGLYFLKADDFKILTIGVSLGEATKPQITWDGSFTNTKKLDYKYTGLFVLPIYKDIYTGKYFSPVSFQELESAYNNATPILAQVMYGSGRTLGVANSIDGVLSSGGIDYFTLNFSGKGGDFTLNYYKSGTIQSD